MGAACGGLNCKVKKHSNYNKPKIIKRPTEFDLSVDEDVNYRINQLQD